MKNAKRLPVIDWNLTFFGAHEQSVDSDWIVPVEKHYAFECIFILNGQEFISIQGQKYCLTKGDFFLIPPEILHQVWAGDKLTYFCFHFDIDSPALKIKLIQELNHLYNSTSKLAKELVPHLMRLDELAGTSETDFDTKMVIQIELSQILQLLYQAADNFSETKSVTVAEYSRMIADYLKRQLTAQILEFVKNGYSTDNTKIEVKSAIEKIGFSSGYGFRIFKETYGISPREYLSRLKVNEAKKLLAKPQYSINDVGTALGYINLSNFSRQFKRWTDETPSSWRRENKR